MCAKTGAGDGECTRVNILRRNGHQTMRAKAWTRERNGDAARSTVRVRLVAAVRYDVTVAAEHPVPFPPPPGVFAAEAFEADADALLGQPLPAGA